MFFSKKTKIDYTHKCLFEFPFTKVGNNHYPYIEVDLYYIDGDKSEEMIMCLLDSGADNSVFPKDLGEKLGIDFSEIDPIDNPIRGIAGEIKDIKMYKSPLNIEFLGTKILTEVIWIDKKDINPVIGRKGFFDKFDVYYKKSVNKITLVFHPIPKCHLKSKFD
jgi:hypothetical protein